MTRKERVNYKIINGSRRKRKYLDIGTTVCHIEVVPGNGAQRARSAGQHGTVVRKEGDREMVWISLKNGKRRNCDDACLATVGVAGNEDHMYTKLGKAGRSRRRGKRPKVRGEAKNPVDHPHGGRTRGGRPEVTPWGRLTKGKPTVPKSRKRRNVEQKSVKGKWAMVTR